MPILPLGCDARSNRTGPSVGAASRAATPAPILPRRRAASTGVAVRDALSDPGDVGLVVLFWRAPIRDPGKDVRFPEEYRPPAPAPGRESSEPVHRMVET